jgi:transposase
VDSDTTAIVHPGGRPSKAEQLLTLEMLEAVAGLLFEGHHKETVADFLGIHRATWWRWEQIGEREPETIYGEFCNITRKAIAGAEIDTIRAIRNGRADWPARAWMAERRFPQRWGKRVEITLRQEAEKLAAEFGIPVEQVLKDAEEAAAGASRG